MRKILLFHLLIIVMNLLAQPVIHRPPEIIHQQQDVNLTREAPEGDEIINPAEFGRTDGVFMAWSGWDTQLIADIAYFISQDYKVFMIVNNEMDEMDAYSFLQSQEVNMENVTFFQDSNISNTSMWIRDFAPFFIKEDGAQAIDDFVYGTYGTDDLISYTISEFFELPIYDNPLVHHGGNHISDGNGMGFCTTNIYDYNYFVSEEEVAADFRNYLGIDSLVVVEPMLGDGTAHIDMFCKLLNDTLFIVGEYDLDTPCYPGDREILNDLAACLGSLTNLDGRPFQVERIPMGPYTYGGPAATINYTYTNSLIVNDLILVPIYEFDMDEDVLQIYEDLMPDHQIIGINSSFIIQYWGAVHCVTNEYYSDNPLIILHDSLTEIDFEESPTISFRLNPKFSEAEASVYYKTVTSDTYTQVYAELIGGIWQAQLPQITEDLEYYIGGATVSGEYQFSATLPQLAQHDPYYVECINSPTTDILTMSKVKLTNYPNPFNPNTTISFNLSDQNQVGKTILKIYNMKGQCIKNLPIPHPSDLCYSILWDGSDELNKTVSSGIYFVRLEVDDHVFQNKILLVK